MKVCIVDTGDGMTGDGMMHLINQLSSSGSNMNWRTAHGRITFRSTTP